MSFFLNFPIFFILIMLTSCSFESKEKTLTVGEKFPSIILPDITGISQQTPDINKSNLLFISIRSIGCQFCETDLKELEKLHSTYNSKELSILSIMVGFEKKSVVRFLKEKPISFQILIDEKSEIMPLIRTPILPVGYLIDSNGIIIFKTQRSLSHIEIKEIVEKARKHYSLDRNHATL